MLRIPGFFTRPKHLLFNLKYIPDSSTPMGCLDKIKQQDTSYKLHDGQARLVVLLIVLLIVLLGVFVPSVTLVALFSISLSLLFSMMFGLFAIDEIKTLGLKELVHLSGCEPGQQLLHGAVAHRFTFFPEVVFVSFHCFEASSASDDLMGKLGLVLLLDLSIVTINLLVNIGGIVVVEKTHFVVMKNWCVRSW